MFDLLAKIFVKNYKDTGDPSVRAAYGTLTSVSGILINILLFAAKFIVGTLTASVAIRADAVNNLSDAGSSVISLISFKISNKPADREHPFGHARIEYIASMLVSFFILYISISLYGESIDKIMHPTPTVFNLVSVIVLCVSIAAKLWMYFFNRVIGKRINSLVMQATATDSISDVLGTAAVLAAVIVAQLTSFNTDGYMGLIVATLILIGGLKILNESKNCLLGEAPDPDMVKHILEDVKKHPEVLGVHDLMVHSYGPGEYFASMHVEVDGSVDIFKSHDAVDNIERELSEMYNIHCSIHLDPIVTGDPLVNDLHQKICAIVASVDSSLTVHDFRMVKGPTHSNLIFDVVMPFECKRDADATKKEIAAKVKEIDGSYFAVVTIDRA